MSEDGGDEVGAQGKYRYGVAAPTPARGDCAHVDIDSVRGELLVGGDQQGIGVALGTTT
ncbi:hypothetical protein [Microbacterium sp. VKM Ac-2870]|uniref:hypothetical protein n=1 Tax=Microbacterium sp. VKM Ac-2870 TaxID=2783825 RepID=UPI001E445AA1|nr:hypothetical protein [Microbacterium sp. VKM Ac-2870]